MTKRTASLSPSHENEQLRKVFLNSLALRILYEFLKFGILNLNFLKI